MNNTTILIASTIIGLSIVLSNGIYETVATGKAASFTVNKFTGYTFFCYGNDCSTLIINTKSPIDELRDVLGNKAIDLSDDELIYAAKKTVPAVKSWPTSSFTELDNKNADLLVREYLLKQKTSGIDN